MNHTHIPQPGEYYYHYKHDPAKGENNYRYEIIALAYDNVIDDLTVIYTPCYADTFLLTTGATQYVRALSNFNEEIMWSDGVVRARFVKCKDISK